VLPDTINHGSHEILLAAPAVAEWSRSLDVLRLHLSLFGICRNSQGETNPSIEFHLLRLSDRRLRLGKASVPLPRHDAGLRFLKGSDGPLLRSRRVFVASIAERIFNFSQLAEARSVALKSHTVSLDHLSKV